MNKSAIWDMDGVLVDTGQLHYQAWVKTFAEYDIPFSETVFKKTFGMNNEGILTYLFKEPPAKSLILEISNKKETLFRAQIRGNAQLMPGVAAWLSRLKESGYTQAIASSAPQANIDALIDELKIRDYFGAIVSGFDLPGKPDPAVFLRAASQLNSPPARCVVIEDATAGIEGARRAGMKCIAVTTTNPAHALSGANIVVDRLTTLPINTFDTLVAS